MIIVEQSYKKRKADLYLPDEKYIEELHYQRKKGCFKGIKVKHSKRGTPVITLHNSNYRLVDIIYYKMGYKGYMPYYRDGDNKNLRWSNIRPYEDTIPIEVTQDVVKELFHYEDGQLIWQKGPRKSRITGLNVMIDGKTYLRSHLVWIYFKASKPKRLKHINNDLCDTRIENLRLWNYHIDHPSAKSNKNTVRGVFKRGSKYLASAYKDGKQLFLGTFNTWREAYDKRKIFFAGHFQYWADRFPQFIIEPRTPCRTESKSRHTYDEEGLRALRSGDYSYFWNQVAQE